MGIHVHLDGLLKARGVTAKELCKQVGITEANLSILRTGRCKGIRFATLNRICHYLQCTANRSIYYSQRNFPYRKTGR